MKNKYPTDKSHFDKMNVSGRIKSFIVKTGSCQPKGPFAKDNKKRSFSCAYYKTLASTGQSPVKWLNYSKKLDCAYCMPCWLFSNKVSGWTTGMNDWQGLSKKLKVTVIPNHIYQLV